MNASSRETREIVVELGSADFELTDVSDRSTDLPLEPASLAPLDLDTTQVVPKLVLSELRHQARLRSAANVPALADEKPADEAPARASSTPAPAPTAVAVPAAVTDSQMVAEMRGARMGVRGAVALGVLIGLSLVAMLFAVLY